jgi:hypothetical protein
MGAYRASDEVAEGELNFPALAPSGFVKFHRDSAMNGVQRAITRLRAPAFEGTGDWSTLNCSPLNSICFTCFVPFWLSRLRTLLISQPAHIGELQLRSRCCGREMQDASKGRKNALTEDAVFPSLRALSSRVTEGLAR